MTKEERVIKVLDLLEEHYGPVKCYLNHECAWQLLIATILSAQCTDARVNMVTEDLFKKYPSIKAFAEADLPELEQDIRSTGFYHNKAKNIIGCCQMLLSEYGGEVPSDIDKLTKLPGVGRKSANLIMGDVFGKPAIVTDTHCIRLTNRIGLVDGIKEPKKVEMALWKIIPPEEGNDFCHRLVEHGRAVCTARTKPYCDKCCLAEFCEKNGVE